MAFRPHELYEKYGASTMCSEQVFKANLDIVDLEGRFVSGTIVECGTWRGGMIAAIAEVLGPSRRYVLADSFQGLPPAQPIDGRDAIEWQESSEHNCAAKATDVVEAMRLSGAPYYEVVPGWFSETLPDLNAGPIALLRLDADWYESTMCCLTHLWPMVVFGGIVIIDDYYVWDGCSRAVHEFLTKMCSSDRIRQHEGVAYIVKGSRC